MRARLLIGLTAALRGAASQQAWSQDATPRNSRHALVIGIGQLGGGEAFVTE